MSDNRPQAWAIDTAATFLKKSLRLTYADSTELFQLAAQRDDGLTVTNLLEVSSALTNMLVVLLSYGSTDLDAADKMIDRLIESGPSGAEDE